MSKENKMRIKSSEAALKEFNDWLGSFDGDLKEVHGVNADGCLRYMKPEQVREFIASEECDGYAEFDGDRAKFQFFLDESCPGVGTMILYANNRNVCNMRTKIRDGRIIKDDNFNFGQEVELAECRRRERELARLMNVNSYGAVFKSG